MGTTSLLIVIVSSCLLFSVSQGSEQVCGTPPVPIYGRIKGTVRESYGIGGYVEYVCDYGYKLKGTEIIVCAGSQEGGQWNSPPPLCISIDCENPEYPINGHVTIPDGTRLGAKVWYACDDGYDLVGSEFRTCGEDEQWVPLLPKCKSRHCPFIRSPPYGKVTITGSTPGSVASYTCAVGFVLVGVISRICQNSGVWSGSSPTCNIVDCGTVPNPLNGQVKFPDGTTLNRQAWFSCFPGYKLVGSEFSTCLSTGEWIPAPPICKYIPRITKCPPLPTPYKGTVFTSGNTPGSTATYSCIHGYLIFGKPELACLDNGQWSGPPPSCTPVDCGRLYSPRNGHVELRSTKLGAFANYFCKEGFYLVGGKSRQCQINGKWSGKESYCEPIDCGPPPAITYGQVSLVNQNTKFGAAAIYKCASGYSLFGLTELICLSSGKWSGQPPICAILDCGILKPPSDGIVELTGTGLGDKAYYSCNVGFTLYGQERRECQTHGEWSGAAPSCKPIHCDHLHSPPNGLVHVAFKTVGSQATYECFKGFILEGVKYRTCHPGGYWSGEEPMCRGITCELLTSPANGAVSTTGRVFGSKARYRCQPGYTLHGDDIRVCQEVGYWSGQTPSCVFNGCSYLENPIYGHVTISGKSLGSTATYMCNHGYVLDGDHKQRVCRSNGEWSGHVPVCIPAPPPVIECPHLVNPYNGRVYLTGREAGSTATYSCNHGYNLIGTAKLICQATGYWSGIQPTCKRIVMCPSLRGPRYGYVEITGTSVGSTAYYTCSKGTILLGEVTRTCTPEGWWSGTEPRCHFPGCPNLEASENGHVSVTTKSVGAHAVYSCNKGFVLKGEKRRVCQSDATWSGTAPTCETVQCEELSEHRNGRIILTGTAIGSKATYICYPKFTLLGASTRVCQPSGEWSGVAPFCEFIDCGYLSNPEKGRVVLSGTICGSTASYSCNEGYRLVGDAARSCLTDASWSGSAPVCIAVNCGVLDNPANGHVVITGTSPSSKATYSCNKGYALFGSKTRVCKTNGEWTEKQPVCKRVVQCEDLANPANGAVNQGGSTPGSTVTYTCNSGFVLAGEETRNCQANGEWSGVAPSCRRVTCDKLTAPANGDINQNGNTPGYIATYTCDPGYELVGGSTRTCQTNGQWSGDAPKCRFIIVCEYLAYPSNGNVDQIGSRPGSTATYTCDRGSVLVGQAERTCQNNGEWSGKAPTCTRRSCGIPKAPRNGFVQFQCRTVGCSAKFSCRNGYTLKGSKNILCENSGSWSRSTPTCEKRYHSYYDH